ncbi:MAG: hypothetical protein H7833_00015 [Magnetococcus sp. DMHC-1]|nr:hypothetical protein [Magnetococcales bacterium]
MQRNDSNNVRVEGSRPSRFAGHDIGIETHGGGDFCATAGVEWPNIGLSLEKSLSEISNVSGSSAIPALIAASSSIVGKRTMRLADIFKHLSAVGLAETDDA